MIYSFIQLVLKRVPTLSLRVPKPNRFYLTWCSFTLWCICVISTYCVNVFALGLFSISIIDIGVVPVTANPILTPSALATMGGFPEWSPVLHVELSITLRAFAISPLAWVGYLLQEWSFCAICGVSLTPDERFELTPEKAKCTEAEGAAAGS